MAAHVPKYLYLELVEAITKFGNIVHQSPKVVDQPSESECEKK